MAAVHGNKRTSLIRPLANFVDHKFRARGVAGYAPGSVWFVFWGSFNKIKRHVQSEVKNFFFSLHFERAPGSVCFVFQGCFNEHQWNPQSINFP